MGRALEQPPPPADDGARHLGPRSGDHTAFSIAGNLGKRALVLERAAATGLISWLEQPRLDRPVPVPNPPGTPPLAPGGRLARAPSLGEHSAGVLAEIGMAP